jgi:hypothetical protein
MTCTDVANQALDRDCYLTWLTPVNLKGRVIPCLVETLTALLSPSDARLPTEAATEPERLPSA